MEEANVVTPYKECINMHSVHSTLTQYTVHTGG